MLTTIKALGLQSMWSALLLLAAGSPSVVLAESNGLPFDAALWNCQDWARAQFASTNWRRDPLLTGCANYVEQGGTLSACTLRCCPDSPTTQTDCGSGGGLCKRACFNFHNQLCTGNGYFSNANFVPSTCTSSSRCNWPRSSSEVTFGSTDRWADKCVLSASSTTRAVAVAGCGVQVGPNRTGECDSRGGTTIVVRVFGIGCSLSTPRPRVLLKGASRHTGVPVTVECTNVTAPSSVPDPGCIDPQIPQALMCTLPKITDSALLDVPMQVTARWDKNTTVRYLADFKFGNATSVTVARTTTALSEATVSYSCLHRECNAAGTPRITRVQGCKGDVDEDPTRTSAWYRRARACSREGSTKILIDGFFLRNANITVGGEPCLDARKENAESRRSPQIGAYIRGQC